LPCLSSPSKIPCVTLEIPRTGERIEGRLTEERFGPLCLTMGRSNLPAYVLSNVLDIGWRIVDCTPAERELMGTHGITAVTSCAQGGA
jgi:hypothetical protein